jgi:hypothetical protein
MLCVECHRKLNKRGICTNLSCPRCGIDPSRERPESLREGDVNPFVLAEKLRKEKEKPREERLEGKPATPELLKCPNSQCGKLSLFWNESLLLYECLNPKCRIKVSKAELEGTHPLQMNDQQELEFTNPLLLTLKMFLAEVRSWRREYIEDEYMCSAFSKEVYEAATQRKIRCGYVRIHFRGSDIAHAIIAFETDYGLKFIEPQSGEEESVVVGRPYPIIMQGVPKGAVVRMVEIGWNDGTSTVID